MFATVLLIGALSSASIGAQAPSGAAAAAAQPSKAKKLNRAELDGLLAQPAKVLVLDVRRPDELTAIGGFPVFLSIQAADLEKHLNAIPKDRLIVTVSNHAARASRAADLLEKHGFKVAGAVGAQDYEAEGGTLTKIAVPAPRDAARQSQQQ